MERIRAVGNDRRAAEVAALVERWLASQNTGDFPAYQALYAARMEGIKRAGGRTYRFARSGWFRDRARMFRRPMKVAASELRVIGTDDHMVVSLVQRFEQGKFQDEGPKQLLLVREQGKLKISREEMLDSRVSGQTVESSGLYLVLSVDGVPYAVLGDGGAGWGGTQQGTYRDSAAEEAVRLTLWTPTREADKAVAKHRGSSLTVYRSDGSTCEAKLALFALLGVLHIRDLSAEEPPEPELLAELDSDMLSTGQGTSLVARLENGCDGAFAVAKGRTVRVLGELKATQDALAGQALTVARAAPILRDIQDAYVDYVGQPPDDRPRWVTTETVLKAGAEAGPWLVTFAGGYGCESFTDGAIMVVDGRAEGPVLRTHLHSRRIPTLLLDLDADGSLEALTGKSAWNERGVVFLDGRARAPIELPVYSYGCGC